MSGVSREPKIRRNEKKWGTNNPHINKNGKSHFRARGGKRWRRS